MTTTTQRLEGVKQIILVLSGKGGVGKSSVACQLALSLYGSSGSARVGLLDVDLTGPSIPRMMGVEGQSVHQSSGGWVPVYVDGSGGRLGCMSVGFLVGSKSESVVWRGPKKNGMIRQFLGEVRWGSLDYLVVDTPPGTSDEHLSLIQHLAPIITRVSCLVVSTPQAVALADAQKSLSFARTLHLPILGLVENMSGYVCPCCRELTRLFSMGGGADMAQREGIAFLGSLPVDPALAEVLDAGTVLDGYQETASSGLFIGIVEKLMGVLIT